MTASVAQRDNRLTELTNEICPDRSSLFVKGTSSACLIVYLIQHLNIIPTNDTFHQPSTPFFQPNQLDNTEARQSVSLPVHGTYELIPLAYPPCPYPSE